MASTRIILPFLNRSVSIYKGPTWYLSDNVAIETINSEDYYLVSNSSSDEYKTLIQTKSKCARIENVDPKNVGIAARHEASKIAFILNCCRKTNPVALGFAVQITMKRKAKLDRFWDLSVVSDAYLQRSVTYHIQKDIKRDTITNLYSVLTTVCKKEPAYFLTIDRYNSALFRKELLDKIIDITISLESMVSGTTELRYKFALFNAWCADNTPEERRNSYDLLTKLYDARSAIVHGTSMSEKEFNKKIGPIRDNWNEITKMAERAIVYYLFYIYQYDSKSWNQHQQDLSIGTAQRII